MIDRAETVIVLYDNNPRGGTYGAVTYAKVQGKKSVINVWGDWQKILRRM